jgi:hypothetical protein
MAMSDMCFLRMILGKIDYTYMYVSLHIHHVYISMNINIYIHNLEKIGPPLLS